MPTTQPIRVSIFAGYGRSGTTVLDIALGQHPAVIGAGEIRRTDPARLAPERILRMRPARS